MTANPKPSYEDLHEAIEAVDIQAVREMVAQNPELIHECRGDHSPLDTAISMRRVELVDAILELGFDVNAKVGYAQMTALHYACTEDDVSTMQCAPIEDTLEIIKRLLLAGAELGARSRDGDTPLHYAVRHHVDSVRVLVEAGADIKAINKAGKSILDGAWEHGQYFSDWEPFNFIKAVLLVSEEKEALESTVKDALPLDGIADESGAGVKKEDGIKKEIRRI